MLPSNGLKVEFQIKDYWMNWMIGITTELALLPQCFGESGLNGIIWI
jgi:hypothetical protein